MYNACVHSQGDNFLKLQDPNTGEIVDTEPEDETMIDLLAENRLLGCAGDWVNMHDCCGEITETKTCSIEFAKNYGEAERCKFTGCGVPGS